MTSSAATGKAGLAIVIPVFNQLAYTRQCLDSLKHAGVADRQIIIVNNASTDGTAEFLAGRPEIRTSTMRKIAAAVLRGRRAQKCPSRRGRSS